MLSSNEKKEYYKALVNKDPDYDGVFYVGVKTTGVFCRSICPARKPKFEHCAFFRTAEEALLSGYRACLRCKPLSHPGECFEEIQMLIEAVEKDPEKRWKEKDFQALSLSSKKASRLFKKRFQMTFVAYARSRRMGIALKEIKEQTMVIDAQIQSGYESSSGFRDAFSKILGSPPVKSKDIELFHASLIDTPLGPMIAVADEEAVVLLEFVNRRGLLRELEELRKKTKRAILPGKTKAIISIEDELNLYFTGNKKHFQTPIKTFGTPFQKKVFQELMNIPYGETRSYLEVAKAINNPAAIRAVGGANGRNQLAIIIPCHRVINANGEVGGYGGGVPRKKWLLDHERK